MYWEHPDEVFGGYKECVGERGFYPCEEPTLAVTDEDAEFTKQQPVYWDRETRKCVETEYTMETRLFWVRTVAFQLTSMN